MKTILHKRLSFYVGTAVLLAGIAYGIYGQYPKANWLLLTYISVWALSRENEIS